MLKAIEEKVRYIRLEKSDVTLAYIDEYRSADAPVIIAVHGLGNSFVVWMNNFHVLKQEYRCIAIDLPGNGLSEKNSNHSGQYNIPGYSECIIEFIEEMGLGSVHLMGHSMGGQIALYTALHHPDSVRSLILLAPAGLEEFSVIEKNLMTSSNQMLDFMMSSYDKLSQALNMSFHITNQASKKVKDALLDMLHLQESLHYKRMLDQCVYSMLYDTVAEDLHRLEHPVMVIFGTEDAMIPNKLFHPVTTSYFATQAVKKLPHAELVLIENAGHFVQLDALERVNAHIQDFLKTSA